MLHGVAYMLGWYNKGNRQSHRSVFSKDEAEYRVP